MLQDIVDSVLAQLPGTEVVRSGVRLNELAEVCQTVEANLVIMGGPNDGWPPEGSRVLSRNPFIGLMVLMDGGRQLVLHKSLGEASPTKLRREIRKLMEEVCTSAS
jgi:hypothetical protein